MSDQPTRQDALPDEPRQVLEVTRFFADQMANLVERMPGGSLVVAEWRKYSAHHEEGGFWGPPLPRDAVLPETAVHDGEGDA